MSAPTRRHFLRLALGAGFASSATANTLVWRERMLLGFGTTLWLRAGHAEAARADAGLDAAVAALRTVEAQMSLFDPASALCRLNRDGALADPPADLLHVLRLARQVAQRSGGTFDPTVQPLWALWHEAARAGRVPDDAQITAARARVDWRGLAITPERITLRPGMAVTLNGIAQGHAAERAREALRAAGIGHALIDAGEWAALGAATEGGPWTIGIADPHDASRNVARIAADGRAIATSSHAQLAFTANRREHHILDPRSGHSPPELASATVLAPDGARADALTKVIFMAGWNGALDAARRFGVATLVVHRDGRVRASAGLRRA